MARMAATQQTQLSLDFGAHFEPARGEAFVGHCLEKAPSFGSSKLLSESYLCFL